jgi:hypothetical protein
LETEGKIKFQSDFGVSLAKIVACLRPIFTYTAWWKKNINRGRTEKGKCNEENHKVDEKC